MLTDAELLRRYAEEKSEEAFTALVQRHLDFVYSAALRRVGGDAHAAGVHRGKPIARTIGGKIRPGRSTCSASSSHRAKEGAATAGRSVPCIWV